MGGVGTVADESFVVEEEAGLAETSEAARRVATSAVDTDASQCQTLVHIYTHTHTHTHRRARATSVSAKDSDSLPHCYKNSRATRDHNV